VLFKLFHIYIVEGIKESLLEDSLQKVKYYSHFSMYTLIYLAKRGESMYKDN
jgi:hypothetical protein